VEGKLGWAALAISLTASLILALAAGLGIILAGRGGIGLNYVIGVTILFCWLFELIAIVIGIIGLFESAPKKRALFAIGISILCFVATFGAALAGKNGSLH
jgi:hypothetical protein